MKKTFIVSFKVKGYYEVAVETDVASDDLCEITENELKEIKRLAGNKWSDADFGELTDIDADAIIIADDTGNIIWDKE